MSDSPDATGTLYIVATPLGNLEDITFRAVTTLKQVSLIAAEDTRHTRKLLSHYGIHNPLISCHEHNETHKIAQIIDQLKSGKDVALVTDAGTPCISDPGYLLVKSAAEQGLRILPVPGCCAAIAGLSVSGLPTDSFLYLGFLPKKPNKRTELLEHHKNTPATLIFYESPKRIVQLLTETHDILGNRPGCLAREITKHYEEYIRGSLTHIRSCLESKPAIKGECTLIVQGRQDNVETIDDASLEAVIRSHLSERKHATSGLARSLADQYGLPRKKVYDLILSLQQKPESL